MRIEELSTMQLGNIICDALHRGKGNASELEVRRIDRAELAILELVDRARVGENKRKKALGENV